MATPLRFPASLVPISGGDVVTTEDTGHAQQFAFGGSASRLESESITIIREVAAEFERPVLLFSGGKDSVVMLHLAVRAFHPAPVPFPVMHVDTGHNFDEVIEFRDRTVERFGVELIVASVQQSIDSGRVRERGRPAGEPQRVADGDPARRHRRASVRRGVRRCPPRRGTVAGEGAGVLASRRVRPVGSAEPASGAVAAVQPPPSSGRAPAIFPLSNWTELDVWRFIEEHEVELPSLYFAHRRDVFERDGMLMAVNPHVQMLDGEKAF